MVWCSRGWRFPAYAQLAYLDDLGVSGSIDELGLEFDDLYRPLASLLGRGRVPHKGADHHDRLVAQSLADELSLVLRGAG